MKTLILLLTLFSSLALADGAPVHNYAASPDTTNQCLEFAKTLKPSTMPCMYVSDTTKYYLAKGKSFDHICNNPTNYKAAACGWAARTVSPYVQAYAAEYTAKNMIFAKLYDNMDPTRPLAITHQEVALLFMVEAWR